VKEIQDRLQQNEDDEQQQRDLDHGSSKVRCESLQTGERRSRILQMQLRRGVGFDLSSIHARWIEISYLPINRAHQQQKHSELRSS